jgi:hypothetical protein
MNRMCPTLYRSHLLGEAATHPIARWTGRLAALLLLVGDGPTAASRPFDRAQDRPFDGAQDRPFDGAQDRPFDGAQDRPFDGAQDRLAIRPIHRTLALVQRPFLGLSDRISATQMRFINCKIREF